MSRKAHGNLIRQIRKFIAAFDGKYTQSHLYIDANKHGTIEDMKTIANAENHHGLRFENFVILAAALSAKLRSLRQRYPESDRFNPLMQPEFGWLIDRLIYEIDPALEPEHLMMNHESRYLVEDYRISLAVCPSNSSVDIEHAGRPPEKFSYDNIATVKYKVKFSEHNQRTEPGFRLFYGTHSGRLRLIEPGEDKLAHDRGYRLHKTSATYLPDPRDDSTHRLELRVYGGYAAGDETAHFMMAQPAIYRNVSFSLDLTAYPEDAVSKPPELIMIPVLTDRPFDCCDIARKGLGLPIPADRAHGLDFKWQFHDLMNVMICVRWQIDRDRIL